jgi:midasin
MLPQDPTTAGKTNLVYYLAQLTGDKLERISNHEHTDFFKNIGGYVLTPDGTLDFL